MLLSFYVMILILANVWFSRRGFQDARFFENYMFRIASVQAGQYYRLVTSSFLHVDLTHLLFNMMTLYFFGDYVVSFFGGFAFWLLYFGSVISGGLLGYFFHQKRATYTAVGASGGVVGILFAALLAYPDMKVGFLFIPIPVPGYLFVMVYLGYTFYGMRQQNDAIGHSAHLGGAVGGVLLSILMAPELATRWTHYILN